MPRWTTWMAVLFLMVAAACGGSPEPKEATPSFDPPLRYEGLRLGALDGYRASFDLRFTGESDWRYRLEILSDGQSTSYDLHLEGLDPERNPGDVRLVEDGGVSRMRGPGTDDECVIFPSDLDMGPIFLTPDEVFPPSRLTEPLVSLGVESLLEREVTHYALLQPQLAGWRDLVVGIWIDDGGTVVRYDLRASGQDPLFGAGEGLLEGQFLIEALGLQNVQPIPGCELGFPLPPDAERVVRLPGLVAYESALGLDAALAAFETVLVEAGWALAGTPERRATTALLTYRTDQEALEIKIELTDNGSRVEIYPGSP